MKKARPVLRLTSLNHMYMYVLYVVQGSGEGKRSDWNFNSHTSHWSDDLGGGWRREDDLKSLSDDSSNLGPYPSVTVAWRRSWGAESINSCASCAWWKAYRNKTHTSGHIYLMEYCIHIMYMYAGLYFFNYMYSFFCIHVYRYTASAIVNVMGLLYRHSSLHCQEN